MKARFSLVLCLLALSAAAVAQQRPASGTSRQSPVERGKYLVTMMGCGDCHSPKKMGPQGPEPDASRLLSGHPEESNLPPPPTLPAGPWAATGTWDLTAWSGPWGISYATNLTPDQNTGISSLPNGGQAEAVAGLRPRDRRRDQGDLRLPALDPGDQKPRARRRHGRATAEEALKSDHGH